MKKLISMILVLVTMMSVLTVPASAAAKKARPSDTLIQQRIDELVDWLEGEYFNVKQDTGCGKKCSGHGCSGCSTEKIVKADWFAEKFDNPIKVKQFGTGNAKSCVGFGWFCGWYIARASDSDTVTRDKIGEYKSNIKKNVQANALPGDYLWVNGHHAVIYLGSSDEGIRVLDSNWSGTYNCKVQVHTIKFKNLSSVRIHRFYSTTGNYCTHDKYETLKKNGTYSAYCKSCGEEYIIGKLDTSAKGTYVSLKKNVNICTQPYKDSGVMCGNKGQKVKCVGAVVNAYGNTWLKTDNGYYIYCENLKKI